MDKPTARPSRSPSLSLSLPSGDVYASEYGIHAEYGAEGGGHNTVAVGSSPPDAEREDVDVTTRGGGP